MIKWDEEFLLKMDGLGFSIDLFKRYVENANIVMRTIENEYEFSFDGGVKES